MKYPEAVSKGGVILAPPFEVTTPQLTVPALFGRSTLRFCPDAEPGFLDATRQVFTRQRYSQSLVSVYFAADLVPLLFRKKKEESSALTLQSLHCVDLESRLTKEPASPHLASGSIVQVSPETSVKLIETRRIMPEGWRLDMLLVDGPLIIRPGRDSDWVEEVGASPSPAMDYFRAAAIHAMTDCEVL